MDRASETSLCRRNFCEATPSQAASSRRTPRHPPPGARGLCFPAHGRATAEGMFNRLFRELAELRAAVASIKADTTILKGKAETMADTLDEIIADVADETTVEKSIVALLNS